MNQEPTITSHKSYLILRVPRDAPAAALRSVQPEIVTHDVVESTRVASRVAREFPGDAVLVFEATSVVKVDHVTTSNLYGYYPPEPKAPALLLPGDATCEDEVTAECAADLPL